MNTLPENYCRCSKCIEQEEGTTPAPTPWSAKSETYWRDQYLFMCEKYHKLMRENSDQAEHIRELEEPDEFHTLRVAYAFQKSIEVLGSLDKARRWFTSPKRALGDKTPLEFCATDIGAEEVCNLLGRIEHGIFA